MAGKKKVVQEQETIPDFDFLGFYNKYKNKIFTGAFSVLVIVIICIFYSNYTKTSEDTAWFEFGAFQQKVFSSPDITQTDIQEIIKVTEGTSVEPWALLFCSTTYFQQRDIENAKALLARLKKDFDNHFICQNDLLFENVNSFMTGEENWMKNNFPQ